MEDPTRPQRVLNVNVGVLGHVDSGKTSLVKALSTSLSTAALDKNPQSQERGITLDLGFSSFMLDFPEHLRADPLYTSGGIPYDKLQFTLVDCPGHASLIRTIIGGAQIIDMMILVIDINRGVQTQTAECVVIGEITTTKLVIILNKVDMIPADQRDDKIEKVQRRLRKIFSTTKFHSAPMICVSAAVGGERAAAVNSTPAGSAGHKGGGGGVKSKLAAPRPAVESTGIGDVVSMLTGMVRTIPIRDLSAPFYFAVDHCFAIKGHGTVLTGTVLSGQVAVHDTIELPDLQELKKVSCGLIDSCLISTDESYSDNT
jgi:selenocysteine-specific elongation factor